MKIVDRPVNAWNAAIAAARARSRVFDHFWRARERYNKNLGGRLAAAIAYYAFFAVFALSLLAYSVVGYVLASNARAFQVVDSFLKTNIPFLSASDIAAGRDTIAVLGAIGLILTGVGWIESLRSSQRAIWGLVQQPGNWIIRRLVDLGVLIALCVLLALSIWGQTGINDQIRPMLLSLTPERVSVGWQDVVLAVGAIVGVLLSLLVNCVVAAAMLAGVARLRMSPARLLPSALLVAVGLSILSTVGRIYINYSSHRPAYQVVGGAVGLLLFLYFFNQLLLFGAALAATSGRGRVVDLAAGSPPPEQDRKAQDRKAREPDADRRDAGERGAAGDVGSDHGPDGRTPDRDGTTGG